MENVTGTPPEPTTPPAVNSGPDLSGQTVGDYHVLRRLGQGGMGQVYLAEQVSLKRKVALKILRPELAVNETALRRFQLEAEAVARLSHANIVQVYTVGEWRGSYYMALEYVEGRNLLDHVTRKGPPDPLFALSIMRQVAAALQRAGEVGITHRDIKPENILLTRKGEVKVADFGLSRVLEAGKPALNLTQSGVTMGTPLYMAPEQVEGKPVDPRADIYSFGVTCYHVLAGRPPFRGSSPFEVALQHVRNEPEPLQTVRPDLPADLCAIVHKMMAKDPALRHQTARDLLRDLAHARETLAGVTGPVAPGVSGGLWAVGSEQAAVGRSSLPTIHRPPPVPRSRRWVRGAFVTSLLLALAAGAALGYFRQRHRPPGSAAERAVAEDAHASEATSLLEWEKDREKLVDQYLNPANGFKDAQTGARVCLDLALTYLEQNLLAEAEQLFIRLEAVRDEPLYETLGILGRAIVFALQDGGQIDSNNHFKKLTARQGEPSKMRYVSELVKANRQLSKWITEAVYHNHSNKVSAREMPRFLNPYLEAALLKGELKR